MLGIKQIQEIIPHRYPFLLIDRIYERGEDYIKGYKNVSVNENFFNGHFPDDPVMPGVLIVEALAQLGAIYLKELPTFQQRLIMFAGIDKARFKRPVVPGDKLDLYAKIIKIKGPIGKAQVEATVDGKVVCTAEIMFSAVER